jgi:diacylglycerol kinase
MSLAIYPFPVADLREPVSRLGRSFGYALRGIWVARRGRNMRIHLVAAGAVGLLAALRGLSGARLGLLALTIGAVLAAELLNTAIERVCDFMCEGPDPRIRDIKDLSAGAVLVVALAAVVVAAAVLVR